NVLKKYIELPPTLPGAPGMFRCSERGLMADLFGRAGFKNIGEEEMKGKVDFIDADTYWRNRTEVSESVSAVLNNTDDATVAAIKNDVFAIINANSINGRALLDYSVRIIYGEKP